MNDDNPCRCGTQELANNQGKSSLLKKDTETSNNMNTRETQRGSGSLIAADCSLRLTAQVVRDQLADLYHQLEERRIQAIQAVEFLGKPVSSEVLKALEDGLQHPSAAVRAAAADVLGVVGGVEQKTVLLLAITDPSWDVRAAVVKALGTLGRATPVFTLMRALREKHEIVRIAAIWALQRLGLERLVDPLEYEEEAQNLSWIFPFAMEPTVLTAMMSSIEDDNELVRAALIQALGEFHTPRFSKLFIKALKDESELVQLEAMHALAALDDQVPLDDVLLMVKNPSELVREEAYKLLGSLSASLHRRTTSEVLLWLLKDEEEDLRSLAAWLLGERRDLRTIDFLLAAQQDKSQSVQGVVDWALGQLVEYEEELLEHSHPPSIENLSLIWDDAEQETMTAKALHEVLEYLTEKRGFIVVDGDEEETIVMTIGYEQSPDEPKGTLHHRLSRHTGVQPLVDASCDDGKQMMARNLERMRKRLAYRPWSECCVLLLSCPPWKAQESRKEISTTMVMNIIGFEQVRSNDVCIDQCQERYIRDDHNEILSGRVRILVETTLSHIHLFDELQVWGEISDETGQSSEHTGQKEQRDHLRRRRRERPYRQKESVDRDQWKCLWFLDLPKPTG